MMSKEKLMRKVEAMAIISDDPDINEGHNRGRKYGKGIGMKRKMSQEEFDKEMVELKERLNIVAAIRER